MARLVTRTRAVDDLFNALAGQPWWVGVVFALVSFPLMHWLAGISNPAPNDPAAIAWYTVKLVFMMFAGIAQYVFPLIGVLGAGYSVYGRAKREGLHGFVKSSGAPDVLQDMTWQEFEMLVGEAFRRKGFTVEETGGAGPDGGVDLILSVGADRYLVQCKQWRALKVGVTTVRELFGVMAAKGASGGFVVTSGEFTKDAAEFAAGRNIELINKRDLLELIKGVKEELAASGRLPAKPDPWSNSSAEAEEASRRMSPPCPVCGGAMVLRVAKRGSGSGSAFWGCKSFPRCRGTLAKAQ